MRCEEGKIRCSCSWQMDREGLVDSRHGEGGEGRCGESGREGDGSLFVNILCFIHPFILAVE